MNLPEDAPVISRPASRLAAGAMALGVHLLFLLLLVFGVSWQTQHPAPVMVDIWDSLPSPPPAVKRPPPPPRQPAPDKVVAPPIVKTPPLPKTPDIALEKAEKARVEAEQNKRKLIQEAEDKARLDAALAKKLHDEEQKKRDLLRSMEAEDLQQRIADEDAVNKARLAKQAASAAANAAASAAASKRQSELARAVGLHRDLISAKVRGNTRLPDNLKGNPEVRCLVKLLPTGEVQSVRVTQTSGNPDYDEAVVRAIEKSSPLPLPADRDARAAFVPELSFVHRPKE